MNHAIMRHCVFIDECVYNIWTTEMTGVSVQIDKYAASEDGM